RDRTARAPLRDPGDRPVVLPGRRRPRPGDPRLPARRPARAPERERLAGVRRDEADAPGADGRPGSSVSRVPGIPEETGLPTGFAPSPPSEGAAWMRGGVG